MPTSSIRAAHVGAPGHPKTTQSPFLARALLFAALCAHVSTITAATLPSLPASAPGFDSGAVVPAKHDAISNDALVDTPVIIDPVAPSVTDLDFEDDDDDDWNLEYDDVAIADERIGVDGMGNAIEKGMMDHSTSTNSSPHPPTTPEPNNGRRPTLRESLLASLARLSSLGFWKGLLGSFLVFWILIASTAGALVAVGIRVRRLERSGRLKRWGQEMRRKKQEEGEEGWGDDDDDEERRLD